MSPIGSCGRSVAGIANVRTPPFRDSQAYLCRQPTHSSRIVVDQAPFARRNMQLDMGLQRTDAGQGPTRAAKHSRNPRAHRGLRGREAASRAPARPLLFSPPRSDRTAQQEILRALAIVAACAPSNNCELPQPESLSLPLRRTPLLGLQKIQGPALAQARDKWAAGD